VKGGVLAVLIGLGVATPASAARLEVIEAPSRHVDPATAAFAGNAPIDRLRATVLLPDGYDGRTPLPVLYLIHPTGGDHGTWARPGEGNIATTASGLPAIVVMPDAGLGFLSNWWNDGRRGDPAWERYYLEELTALIERRYRIRPGRRWRAIAGYSMGGMGAPFLAGQRPGYFGAAVSLSGFPSIQRPYLEPGWQGFTGVDYREIWGPSSGFYATGHNPAGLTDNLRHTRLFVSAGDGTPRPGVPRDAGAAAVLPFLSLLEQESRLESDDLVSAARASGVDVTYITGDGVHDWPYVNEDLQAAIRWGLFEPVAESPAHWTYRTVAQTGEAWGLHFAFADPPGVVETLRWDAPVLTGEGRGRVTITTEAGCELSATLPFRRLMPAGVCTDGRIRLAVAPRRVRAGARVRIRLRATTLSAGRRVPVPGARFGVLGRSALADRRGRARMLLRVPPGRRHLSVRATKGGLTAARTTVRVAPRLPR
jgi:diacylglycerol O-acyltransferase / trehalose O-mycolyltransferase